MDFSVGIFFEGLVAKGAVGRIVVLVVSLTLREGARSGAGYI